MLSDENDHFVRDFEVAADATLLDMHEFIISMLNYDPCMASFFKADDRWERQQEYTYMATARLCDVLNFMHDRLIYVFDPFTQRAYYIEVIEAKDEEKGMSYPRLQFEHSPAPDQYDPEASEQSGSIFEEMMGEYSDFDGDDSYDDEY